MCRRMKVEKMFKLRINRKIFVAGVMAGVFALSAAGCGKQQGGSRLQSTNQVENAIKDQMNKEDGSTAKPADIVTTEEVTTTETTTEADSDKDNTAEVVTSDTLSTDDQTTTEDVTEEIPTLDIDPSTIDYSDIDIDLTAMSSDMVYSTVYQMVYNPKEYIGKTIKMAGQYFVAYSNNPENTNFYNYCLVADAKACCQQGLEFACADGHNTYPDDFPEDETNIEVVGVFEMYEEEGYTYTRLNYAKMDVVN